MEVNWASVGVGISSCVAIIGANAYIMKIVIENAILKCLHTISEEYVLKADFDKHVTRCPAREK